MRQLKTEQTYTMKNDPTYLSCEASLGILSVGGNLSSIIAYEINKKQ